MRVTSYYIEYSDINKTIYQTRVKYTIDSPIQSPAYNLAMYDYMLCIEALTGYKVNSISNGWQKNKLFKPFNQIDDEIKSRQILSRAKPVPLCLGICQIPCISDQCVCPELNGSIEVEAII